ncbi:MLV-related proviral Env polyprotein-like [Sylvia atricapilla]|uniref:MLV-related proviral Env polyprotein-like n=1 Tax=Sylvia atricapilla TaxID=48155 RepID=UPI0033921107
MVLLVARGNRVDERGRGVKGCGERNPQGETTKQYSGNCLKTGNRSKDLGQGNRLQSMKWKNPQICFHPYAPNDARHLTQQITFLLLVLYLGGVSAVDTLPHQPFKWSLTRWDDSQTLQTITTVGAPSFMVGLCSMTNIDHCGKVLNLTGFYMCPSLNRGKGYCNLPGEYFCGYWGCETIASDWAPGGGPDEYLKVDFGPVGCTKPWRGPSGETIYIGTCFFLYVNVTQPEKQEWLLGKTWGIRHWEPGRDRGNLILIKKEPVPHDTPKGVGPNPVLVVGQNWTDTTNSSGSGELTVSQADAPEEASKYDTL